MCQIGLELTTSVQNGLSVASATGRYRLQGTSTWTTFPINLSNPLTPDITTLGIYELQVNIADSSGVVSAWSPALPTTFEISQNCLETTTGCNFDGLYYHYNLSNCRDNSISVVRSTSQLSIGSIVQTTDTLTNGEIISEECGLFGTAIVTGPYACPSGVCVKYRITNVGAPSGYVLPPYIACGFTSDTGSGDPESGGGEFIGFGQSIDICAYNYQNPSSNITIQQLGAGLCG